MRIAIVHDWLPLYGGAERVLEQMLCVFPEADLFSLIDHIPEGKRNFLLNKRVQTSFVQKLPFARKKYRSYFPLMPLAVEQFDLSAYDVILSSSYAFAKGALSGPDQLHICYCHSPARYAWDLQHQYLANGLSRNPLLGGVARAALHYIRLWDARTAHGVDQFVANSHYVARRIRKVYRRESHVIYPPVDTDSFRADEQREAFYFTASRMVPYKRMDTIVEAFAEMPERKLVVVGDGPELNKIRRKATPNIELLGHQSGAVLRDYLQRCRAFIFAAEEDFGIVAVEAQAAGAPVIAYGRGGVTETVVDGRTGLFFPEQTAASLRDAVAAFESRRDDFDPQECRNNAERFSIARFRQEFRSFVNHARNSF